MKKQDMNLLEGYQRVLKQKANRDATTSVYAMLVFGVVVIALAYYAVLFYENHVIKEDIKVVQDYINSPQVVSRNDEVSQLMKDITTLESMSKELQSASVAFEFIPKPDSELFNRVLAERPGSIKINSILFGEGDIILEVTGTRIYSISDYVLRLRRMEFFQEVRYNGYTVDEGLFNASIRLQLKGEQ